jgi:hypothetical protein
VIERRSRLRWRLLAQSVLFALVQSARLTWTGMLELLGLAEVHTGAVEGGRRRRLTLTSVATEQADQFDDDWLRDMVVSITVLAARLDYDSRELAFSLAPPDWWVGRTRELAE